MTNKELSIIMRLKDEVTKKIQQIQGHIANFSKSVRDYGKDMEKFAQHLGKVSNNVAFLGAAITGPLALAFKNSSDYSGKVSFQMERLNIVTRKFQLQIATSILPVVEKLINILSSLLNWLNSLSPALKEIILQGALVTGILFTLGGVSGILASKFIMLIGVITSLIGSFGAFAAINLPLIIIAGTITGIVFAMLKWKEVADVIVNTFQIMFNFLTNGFDTVLAGIHTFAADSMKSIGTVLDGLSKIPGPQKKAFIGMAENAHLAAEGARVLADEALKRVIDRANEIGGIFSGENGSWAEGFANQKDQLINHIKEIQDKIKGLSDNNSSSIFTWGKFKDASVDALSSLSTATSAAAANNKKFAVAAQATAIGMTIISTASAIMKIWEQWGWPLGAVFGGIAAAAGAIQIATIAAQKFHDGGIVRAHNGLAIDEVPIIAQTGERVLSRGEVGALGGFSGINNAIAGRGTSRGGGDINISIGPVYQQAGEDVNALAEKISELTRRNLRYYGLT